MAHDISNLLKRAGHRIGSFSLERSLSGGNTAPVWLATQSTDGLKLERRVALKIFHRDQTGLVATSSGSEGSIFHEASMLSQVSHVNVVKFYTAEYDQDLGLYALAMEYLDGETLYARLRRGPPLCVRELVELGLGIASALVEIHKLGLMHRDVKPANIIKAGTTYKLIDFGVAGAAQPPPSARQPRSVDGIPLADIPQEMAPAVPWKLFGTIGYIDPAHYKGGQPTAYGDIYSLGATLYEAATGLKPATRRGERQTLRAGEPANATQFDHAVLRGDSAPPSIGSLLPSLPKPFSTLIMRMLSSDPRQRPPDANVVFAALEGIASSLERPIPPVQAGGLCGFPGFDPYTTDDSGSFFFRDVETKNALGLLRARPVLFVSGPEGCGKTSFVRAGLIAGIKNGALGDWPRTWKEIRVGQQVTVDELCKSLGRARRPPNEFIDDLVESVQREQVGVCLFLDDFKMTCGTNTEDEAWIKDFIWHAAEYPAVGFALILAADDKHRLPSTLARHLSAHTFKIAAIPDTAWGEVIDLTLASQGYSFETAYLRQAVISQIEAGGLPMALAQFALQELWEQRDLSTRQLTQTGWMIVGSINESIARLGNRLIEGLGEDHVPLARKALTTIIGPNNERLRLPHETFTRRCPGADYILERLVEAKLVRNKGNVLSLSHELIISSWSVLGEWAHANREDAVLWQKLEADSNHYRSQPNRKYLWHGSDLRCARRIPTSALSASEQRFVTESSFAYRRRILRKVAIATLGVAGLVLLSAAVTYEEHNEPQMIRLGDADSGALLKQLAKTVFPDDPAAQANLTKEISEVMERGKVEAEAGRVAQSTFTGVPSRTLVNRPRGDLSASAGHLVAQPESLPIGMAPTVNLPPHVRVPTEALAQGGPDTSPRPLPPQSNTVVTSPRAGSSSAVAVLSVGASSPVAEAPLPVSPAQSTNTTTLTPELVRARVGAVVKTCVAQNPSNSAVDLKIVLLVNADGNVDWARIESTNTTLSTCVSEGAKAQNFGRNDAKTTVVGFPYHIGT